MFLFSLQVYKSLYKLPVANVPAFRVSLLVCMVSLCGLVPHALWKRQLALTR